MRSRSIIIAALILASCSSSSGLPPPASNSQAEPSNPSELSIEGARTALISLERIADAIGKSRQSGLLGLYVSEFLARTPSARYRGALTALRTMGIFDQQSALGEQDETFTLLQEFGTVLQVNIHDELNRSQDRATALNIYLQALADITERAKKQLEILTVEQKKTEKEASDQRRKVNELKSAISKAQKSGDFAASGTAQKELVKEQAKQAELDSRVQQLKDLVQIYKQLITIAGKRYDAIQQNREIIISGLKVIDVPGIEDLDILKAKNKRRSDGGGFDLGFGNL